MFLGKLSKIYANLCFSKILVSAWIFLLFFYQGHEKEYLSLFIWLISCSVLYSFNIFINVSNLFVIIQKALGVFSFYVTKLAKNNKK